MYSSKKKTAGKNRKTRAELNAEGRERKRLKKHRGHSAGSRYHDKDSNGKNGQKEALDPRLGSKKPVPLIIDPTAKKSTLKPAVEAPKVVLSPEAELAMLENDDRLDALLERIEAGERMNREDQQYIDTKLDRINELMTQLGIEFSDEEEDEEEKPDDIMRLLKGN